MILATGNRHKLAEMAELLPSVELKPLPEGFEMPPEDGDSFAANALIKARAAHQATGEVTIADDSGIAAEDLDGAPGIYWPATPAREPATRSTSTSCCAKSTPLGGVAAPPTSARSR